MLLHTGSDFAEAHRTASWAKESPWESIVELQRMVLDLEQYLDRRKDVAGDEAASDISCLYMDHLHLALVHRRYRLSFGELHLEKHANVRSFHLDIARM